MQNMVEHVILESREKLGGTWLVNTYPGIQCDVPAHIYVSSEASYCTRRNQLNEMSKKATTQLRTVLT